MNSSPVSKNRPPASLEAWAAAAADWLAARRLPQALRLLGAAAPALAQTLRARGFRPDGLPEDHGLLVVCDPDPQALSPADWQAAGEILVLPAPPGEQLPALAGGPPLQAWAAALARAGFFRDLEEEPTAAGDAPAFFRRPADPGQASAGYEARLWQLEQERQARRALTREYRSELSQLGILDQALRGALAQKDEQLAEKDRQLGEKDEQIAYRNQVIGDKDREILHVRGDLDTVLNSTSWRMMVPLQRLRERIIPPGSRAENALRIIPRGLRIWRREGLGALLRRIGEKLSWEARVRFYNLRFRAAGPPEGRLVEIAPLQPRPPLGQRQATIDVVICVHNALADVQRCLESVLAHCTQPYSLILVDDGSGPETGDFLAAFSQAHGCALLRNEQAGGYTRAANQGLRAARADFVVLLNSDTIVTPGWLDRLAACAEARPKIGLVGPLSNTASWQSIPEIEFQGDWADNPLPPGVSVAQMGEWVARSSARLYPWMAFLNGFCLMIRRQVIEQVGYFDEEAFGEGYGEENDYVLRARAAGWELALADDAYVYHAQSRSYNHERRKRLSDRAGVILAQKHGQAVIDQGVAYCHYDRVLEGMRARSRQVFARQELLRQGRERFARRRALFVLPIQAAGGGGNVVLLEAQAMRQMGADVHIYNLRAHRQSFEAAYPGLEIPVVYGEIDELPQVAARYEAVVATFNPSVAWMEPARQRSPGLIFGYYTQDFEPYFYPPESDGYRQAWDSYTLIPGLRCFTKTEWTRQELARQIGVESQVVGPSLDIDLFLPRPRSGPEWPDRPLRVGAMIRPASTYRAAPLTMEILQRLSLRYGPAVEIRLFGTDLSDPGFTRLPQRFAWSLAGILNPWQVTRFHNELDLFVDFSSHQAMGLTAMEGMACGAAVIVPANGGATSFARHEHNSLVIDTTNTEACWAALLRLVDDHNLRRRLQRQALLDIPQYFPERPAYNILEVLFGARQTQP